MAWPLCRDEYLPPSLAGGWECPTVWRQRVSSKSRQSVFFTTEAMCVHTTTHFELLFVTLLTYPIVGRHYGPPIDFHNSMSVGVSDWQLGKWHLRDHNDIPFLTAQRLICGGLPCITRIYGAPSKLPYASLVRGWTQALLYCTHSHHLLSSRSSNLALATLVRGFIKGGALKRERTSSGGLLTGTGFRSKSSGSIWSDIVQSTLDSTAPTQRDEEETLPKQLKCRCKSVNNPTGLHLPGLLQPN